MLEGLASVREELAGQLRQLRDLTGLSLRGLARDVRGSSSSLSRYFSGQAVPPWPTVVALCKAAGRDPRPLREVWERAKGAAEPSVTTALAPVRNDLPHDITAFTGRGEELAALLGAARTTTMAAIDGMGGVGKTALAVHGAHLLSAEFPGGQLYLDLHGFTPGREPVEPAEALRVLLAALGVPPGRIPDGVTERAALWRSELAARRAIVLLDNAADADQVRDLLPGAGQSFAVITSRRRMVGLDGVQPISLDVLPTQEAAELFIESAGGARPGDVGEVLRRCGNLPLAIRVAAARLLHRPAWTLDTLVERLREGELAVSDVFAMSLRQLDSAQRRMFGLLGLVPGEDIDAYGAAALAGIPLGQRPFPAGGAGRRPSAAGADGGPLPDARPAAAGRPRRGRRGGPRTGDRPAGRLLPERPAGSDGGDRAGRRSRTGRRGAASSRASRLLS